MKQFFLESGRDVVRAIESEIESMASISTSTSGTTTAPTVPSNAVLPVVTTTSSSLSYLSILLGLVESQLIHPNNLTPITTVSNSNDDNDNKRQHETSTSCDESLLHLKGHDNDDHPIVNYDSGHEEDICDTIDDDDDDMNTSDNESSLMDFYLPNAIPFSRIKSLTDQFKCLIKGSVDLSTCDVNRNPREIVSRVADVIWSNLSSSSSSSSNQATDHHTTSSSSASHVPSSSHVQFLNSFLTERRLDSFGLTFAVYAGLEVLFPRNFFRFFRLCLTEDHSFIAIVNGGERVEVTWHGKTDMRWTQNTSSGTTTPGNWLYLLGHHVTCDSVVMAAAALICSMNPAINANCDSLPLALIQKSVLKRMHEYQVLRRYPMALGTLADLIELTCGGEERGNNKRRNKKNNNKSHNNMTSDSQSVQLYIESIASSQSHYADHHIYPYLYLGAYAFRQKRWSESLYNWKQASRVLSKYNYNPKEDEEAYNELREISNDLIPYALTQLMTNSSQDSSQLTAHNYRDLIEFYDGLCGWEEESKWPILHIGWSKPLIQCLNKFPPQIRTQIAIHGSDDDDGGDGHDGDEKKDKEKTNSDERSQRTETHDENQILEIVSRCASDPQFLIHDSLNKLQESEAERVKEEEMEHLNDDVLCGEKNSSPTTTEAKIKVRITSRKMCELKDLLTKREGKLNSSAIQLSITAQSSLFSSSSPSSSSSLHHHHHPYSSSSGTCSPFSTTKMVRRSSTSAKSREEHHLSRGSPMTTAGSRKQQQVVSAKTSSTAVVETNKRKNASSGSRGQGSKRKKRKLDQEEEEEEEELNASDGQPAAATQQPLVVSSEEDNEDELLLMTDDAMTPDSHSSQPIPESQLLESESMSTSDGKVTSVTVTSTAAGKKSDSPITTTFTATTGHEERKGEEEDNNREKIIE